MRPTTTMATSKLFSSIAGSSSLPQPIIDPSTGEEVIDLDEKLKDKRVALYFTAGWCPMCTSFEPALMSFQQNAKDAGKPIELIYISSDRNEETNIKRASQLNMYTVPFGDQTAELKKKYKIWAGSETFQFGFGRRSGVPAIVVLDKTGEELAFVAAESQGAKALATWPLDEALGIWGTKN
ncbi:putative nucleoredoxin [Fragilariopsis cylindrus CCMP1102]|nr:putative nucleoredoxin [Fragilariopsis cylindrus CCMP1102]|eukprot:OEU23720.1 putative nucleoredoxin [Fragilariopsis cylindrus CCMP1102]